MSDTEHKTQHAADLEYLEGLVTDRMDELMKKHTFIRKHAQDISSYKSTPQHDVDEWNTLSRLYRDVRIQQSKQRKINQIESEDSSSSERHESYGSIVLSNPSGQVTLFGSGIKHQHFVSLTIHRASMRRELHRDWIHPEEELISIDMSHEQWGRFISGVGRGEGTPCTISSVELRSMDPPPFVNKQKQYANELTTKISGLIEKMERLSTTINEPLRATGAISKKDRLAVASAVDSLVQAVRSNLPFLVSSYNETLEKMVGAALTEVESYINHTARLAGSDVAARMIELQNTITDSIDSDHQPVTLEHKQEE